MASRNWAERITKWAHPERKPGARRVRDSEHTASMSREQLEASISIIRTTR
jgi:hypothetical protein